MGNKNSVFNKKLGLTLRALREFAALSREKVTEATGITVSALTAIEDGRKPTSKQLSKLLSLYGWSVTPASGKQKEKTEQTDSDRQEEKERIKEPNGPWVLYTDGSCVPNPGKGAYAHVLIYGDEEVSRDSAFIPGPTTNNEMELMGVIDGLEEALINGARKIDVYTDSSYVVNGINEWIYAWLASDPELTDRKNGSLWLKLHRLRKKFASCCFHWVRGHNGNQWNEICDSLCEREYSKRGLPGQEYFNVSVGRATIK